MQDPSITQRQATLLAALRFLFPDCVRGNSSETGELDVRPIRNDEEALTILSNELRARRFPALTAPRGAPERIPLEEYRMSPEPIALELQGCDGALGISLDRVGGLVGLAIQKDILLRHVSETPAEYEARKDWWFREGHRWRPSQSTPPGETPSTFQRIVEQIGKVFRRELPSASGATDAAERI